MIFKNLLESKSGPVAWKKRRITALFKKGSKNLESNYRPVGLTSKVCKCLEKLAREHIIGYMKENNLFSKKQYGFITSHPTTLQLLSVLDKWTIALDTGHSVDYIYMDQAKAFNTVAHRRLILKLLIY